jgi:hypothetical protein
MPRNATRWSLGRRTLPSRRGCGHGRTSGPRLTASSASEGSSAHSDSTAKRNSRRKARRARGGALLSVCPSTAARDDGTAPAGAGPPSPHLGDWLPWPRGRTLRHESSRRRVEMPTERVTCRLGFGSSSSPSSWSSCLPPLATFVGDGSRSGAHRRLTHRHPQRADGIRREPRLASQSGARVCVLLTAAPAAAPSYGGAAVTTPWRTLSAGTKHKEIRAEFSCEVSPNSCRDFLSRSCWEDGTELWMAPSPIAAPAAGGAIF